MHTVMYPEATAHVVFMASATASKKTLCVGGFFFTQATTTKTKTKTKMTTMQEAGPPTPGNNRSKNNSNNHNLDGGGHGNGGHCEMQLETRPTESRFHSAVKIVITRFHEEKSLSEIRLSMLCGRGGTTHKHKQKEK